MTEKKVVTRFAPSPTGFLHIGGIRTALFAYLLARKHGGTFILRIEDTDRARVVPGSLQHIQESLKWLGLDWDFGPDKPGSFGSTIQSERKETYLPWAQKLIDKGLAYPDPYTPAEVEEFRKKAEEEKRPFLYRDHRPDTFGVWDGKTALRYKVPEIKRYEWHDEARGDLSAGPEALDDIVIIKADGFPVYALAHIVDDYNMGVTHILRSDEWISSVPRFLSLYESLEITPPIQATLPPILRDDRTKKLGKRDGAKDVLDYKKEGYLPIAILNFLALIGWNPGTDKEIFTINELIDSFSLDRIQKAGGAFNEDKLDWMNKEHMKLLPKETIADEVLVRLKNCDSINNSEKLNDKVFVGKISAIIFEHISKWGDVETMAGAGELGFYFNSPEFESTLLVWKEDTIENVKKHLEWVKEKLSGANDSDFESPESVKTLVFEYATENGRGNVLWPLRVSLSGKDKSPDPFTLLYVFGKDESIKRIENALTKISK